MTPRNRITAEEIVDIRNACLDGVSIHDLAARYGRSNSTIAKHTSDLRAKPELPPIEVAPDNPEAERWEQRAACRWSDVDTFFPNEEDKPGIDFAKRICGACAVRATCLQEALDSNLIGIWGGTTDRQRSGMKARARRAAAA